jgi:hypothetical protein
MRAKKEYVLRWRKDNEKAFPTLANAKDFAAEHVPDPNGRWYQAHPGEWYRDRGRDQSFHAIPHIARRKVTRKTQLPDSATCPSDEKGRGGKLGQGRENAR